MALPSAIKVQVNLIINLREITLHTSLPETFSISAANNSGSSSEPFFLLFSKSIPDTASSVVQAVDKTRENLQKLLT